jgi:hypothetical protein
MGAAAHVGGHLDQRLLGIGLGLLDAGLRR